MAIEKWGNGEIPLRDLRFDNVPFGRTQFAPTLWTKSVTVGAQSLRPPINWDIIPTQVPNIPKPQHPVSPRKSQPKSTICFRVAKI
ncbi:hypothetical protein B5D77_03555 [Microcystis sp. MC19]|nr:hypothetical protein B5D77_03555 [Microcystis sp. MC19]